MVFAPSRAALFVCGVTLTGLVQGTRGRALDTRSTASKVHLGDSQQAWESGAKPNTGSTHSGVHETKANVASAAIALESPYALLLARSSIGTTGSGEGTATATSLPCSSTTAHSGMPRDGITSTTYEAAGPTSYIAMFSIPGIAPPASATISATPIQQSDNAIPQLSADTAVSRGTIAAIVICPVLLLLLVALAALKYVHRAPPERISPRLLYRAFADPSDSSSYDSRFTGDAQMREPKLFEDLKSGCMQRDGGEWLEEWRQGKERRMRVNVKTSAKKPVPELMCDLPLPLPPIDLEAGAGKIVASGVA